MTQQIRHISRTRLDREAALEAARRGHEGCLPLRTAAKIISMHRNGAKRTLLARGVLHHVPGTKPSRTQPYEVSYADLRAIYPNEQKLKPASGRYHRPPPEEQQRVMRSWPDTDPDITVPGTPEYEEAKQRDRKR